mgnify:CR=1 FL=1
MLADVPDQAIPLVFRLLGETGSHASILNDVILETIGGVPGGTPPMPYAGGDWVVWSRSAVEDPTLGGQLEALQGRLQPEKFLNHLAI